MGKITIPTPSHCRVLLREEVEAPGKTFLSEGLLVKTISLTLPLTRQISKNLDSNGVPLLCQGMFGGVKFYGGNLDLSQTGATFEKREEKILVKIISWVQNFARFFEAEGKILVKIITLMHNFAQLSTKFKLFLEL